MMHNGRQCGHTSRANPSHSSLLSTHSSAQSAPALDATHRINYHPLQNGCSIQQTLGTHPHDPLPDNQTQDQQRRRHRRLPRRRHARPIRRLPNLPPATGSPAPHHLRKRRRPQLHRRQPHRFIPEARQAKFQAPDQVRYRARQVNPRRHRRRTLHRPLPRKRNGRRAQELQTPPPHGRRPRAPKPRLRQIRPHRTPEPERPGHPAPLRRTHPAKAGTQKPRHQATRNPPTPNRSSATRPHRGSPDHPDQPDPEPRRPARTPIRHSRESGNPPGGSPLGHPGAGDPLTPHSSPLTPGEASHASPPTPSTTSHPNSSSTPSSTSSKTWATDTPAT